MSKNPVPADDGGQEATEVKRRGLLVKLPLETEAFFALDGELLKDASTTRTLEQYLIARAEATENVAALVRRIKSRSRLLNLSPRQLIYNVLRKRKYGERADLADLSAAFCVQYGLPLDEVNPDDPTDPDESDDE